MIVNGELFLIILGLSVFAIGACGLLFRRSGLVALMCLELMLNGINILLITFSIKHGNAEGSALVLFIILIAAAEAAVGLSLFVALFRKMGSVYLEDYRQLRG